MLGNLPKFAADATDLLQVLDVQHSAVVQLVQNGGTVFAALSQNQSALRNLITTGETTFATTAANNNAIAATFHVFPTFLNETKATMTRPAAVRDQHRPADQGAAAGRARPRADAAPVRTLSPDLRRLFVKLGPLVTVSKTGLPGTETC